MNKEMPGKHPAFEKIKGLFTWSKEDDKANPQSKVLRINHKEEIRAELFSSDGETKRDFIQCRVIRSQEQLMSFAVGEHGLESIGFGKLQLSFFGSSKINICEGISIGRYGDMTSLFFDEGDRHKFEDLANTIAEWMAHVVLDSEVGEIPVSLIK